MTEGKYRTHEICQFDYSDIWEKSFDERCTDTPLRNDEIIKLLNEQEKWIEKLEKENSDLKVLVKDLVKKGRFNKHILKAINGDSGLTKKRFMYDSKTDSILKDGEFWLDGQVDTACNRNEICDELNSLVNKNEYLKQQINDIRLDWNQDYREFNKDTLYIEDYNTKIKLKDGRLHIEVFIPKLDEYFRFNYIVTGRKLERGYNIIKGDCDE